MGHRTVRRVSIFFTVTRAPHGHAQIVIIQIIPSYTKQTIIQRTIGIILKVIFTSVLAKEHPKNMKAA